MRLPSEDSRRDPSAGVIQSPDVVFRQLGEATFLCNLKTNRMFELNATGARVWELLGAGLTPRAVSLALADEFDEPVPALAASVDQLVHALLAEGLLQRAPATPARGTRSEASPLPAGWLLRWEPDKGFVPDLVSVGAGEATVRAVLSPAGDFVVFDGYLFDPAARGETAARRVAEAFAARGVESVDRLRGAFIIAIWERVTRRLLVVRDALGISPCYYAYDGRTLLLSTDIGCLLAQPEVTRAPNEKRLAEYVYRLTCSAQNEETYFRDVKRVPGAHVLRVDGAGLRLERYWDPLPADFQWADPATSSTLEATLEQAVARCLSVGADSIALSGGFDSLAIACVSSRLTKAAGQPPPAAISLHFNGVGVDESHTQRAAARALGMAQRLEPFPAADLDAVALRALESGTVTGPVLSPWQWMYESLLRGSTDIGATRMMLGSGGDEMFNVDVAFAADLLAGGDLRGVFEFVRAWQRTSPLKSTYVLRYIVWSHGFRRLLGASVHSHLPALGRRLRSTPVWARRMRLLGASARTIASVAERASASARRAPRAGHYVQTLRDLLQNPTIFDEFEQSAGWASRAGVELMYPFFDQDLVGLTLRLKPQTLYANGRMKAPLRTLVQRDLQGIPQKKVDFTRHANELLQRGGPAAWPPLRDLSHLANLGIVSRDEAQTLVDKYLAGEGSLHLWTVWAILSAEDWLRRHSPVV